MNDVLRRTSAEILGASYVNSRSSFCRCESTLIRQFQQLSILGSSRSQTVLHILKEAKRQRCSGGQVDSPTSARRHRDNREKRRQTC